MLGLGKVFEIDTLETMNMRNEPELTPHTVQEITTPARKLMQQQNFRKRWYLRRGYIAGAGKVLMTILSSYQ